MNKETIVEQMNGILAELSMMNDEKITDENYQEYYEEAADELDRNDGEDDDGELDIYRFNFRNCEEYCNLRHELREILVKEGLDLDQRKDFYKNNLRG